MTDASVAASAARAAQRYNVRSLLSSSERALRAEVAALHIPTHQLPLLASHASVEVLAIDRLDSEDVAALQRVINERGGALLTGSDRQSALLIVSLLVAGELRQLLSAHGRSLGVAISDTLIARGVVPPPLNARGHTLSFGERTLVMGVVNVTPDSFSGDGLGDDRRAALAQAEAMVEAGANIIDVGGESTRPNSVAVSLEEELSRVMPIVQQLVRSIDVPVSIDTRKAAVARAALDAGAAIVNDIWGLRGDVEMAKVVASDPDVALIAMHNQHGVDYVNLIADICAALRESVALAVETGIAAERVIIDPGFGFGKTPAQNLEVMRRLPELRGIGRPVLVGPSRKSTIGVLTGGAAVEDRVEGSLALAALSVSGGADIVRVHDVRETVRAVAVADAVVRGAPQHVESLPRPGPTG